MVRHKVNNACARCRKQKLRCDVEWPCTMCTRAGVQCVEVQPQWRIQTSAQARGRIQKTRQPSTATTRRSGEPRDSGLAVPTPSPAERTEEPVHRMITRATSSRNDQEPTHSQASDQRKPQEFAGTGGSSSTILLVEEAFHHHDATSPETSETSALGYGHTSPHPSMAAAISGLSSARPRHARISSAAVIELTSILPGSNVTSILVDNYFNKIHWFMLLFHQREFRLPLSCLYHEHELASQTAGRIDTTIIGYITVLLAVCAISLRYTSPDQQHQLLGLGVNHEILRERILTTLRLRLLDILALGSLEAVQMCVLLGSYYLYHGEPELAWPLCGSALRLAQALQLHRHPKEVEAQRLSPCGSLSQRDIEERKRCWWAVHEIETFCSMIYGFPLNISDADCTTEPLNPYDPWSIAADGQPPHSDQPTLLVYKCSMSALSRIVKSALEDLYRPRKCLDSDGRNSETPSQLQSIVKEVASFDAQLTDWYSNIPSKLKLGRRSESDSRHSRRAPGNDSQSTGGSFDEQLFHLQALALKLAFENARILIHRPILSYKSVDSPSYNKTGPDQVPPRDDYFATSVRACRDAALQISWAGQIPIFKQASTTYALNFISLHLLTAGMTMCILTSLNPLSQESFESKMSIRRLMEMQMALESDSIVAEQGLRLLRKLLSLVMKKETDKLLEFGSQTGPMATERADETLSDTSPCFLGRDDVVGVDSTPMESPQLATQMCNDLEPFSTAAAAAIAPFDGCAGNFMSQAMLDNEQASASSQNVHPMQNLHMAIGLAEFTSNHPFIGQDQSWMWGPAVDIGRLF